MAESDGIATVGAGARLGEIDERLATDALAIPAGSCPAVGIAGLTLGGGLGILGHTYGLTSDQLVQAQVVLADGRVVECDERREEGLFWALRGAGAGQFGVVTSFSFQAVPAPDLTCFRLVWPLAKAADLLEVWQSWAPSAPDELAASMLLNVPADPERPPTATLFGSSLGAKDETERFLEELVVGAGEDPASTTIEYLQYIRAKRYLWEHAPGAERMERVWPAASRAPPSPSPNRSSSGEGFLGSRSMRSSTSSGPDEALGQAREARLPPWGGAYTRLDPEATAFPHRRERFLLKHAVNIDNDASTERQDAAREWLRDRGARPSLGSRRHVSQLRRPRTDRPCDRVLARIATAWCVSRRNTTPTICNSPAHGKRQERLP